MGDSLHEILQRPNAGKRSISINSTKDSKTNETWKDQTIRLYFQNVNGLRTKDAGTDATEIFLHLKNIQADIFGLAETQLHCRDQQVQRQIQESKRQVWDHCKIFTCSSEEAWDHQWKPGGVLLGITGSLAGRVRKQYLDKYGRWIRVDLLGRDGRTVTLICAYQVVQEKGEHGARTTYSQQVRMMRLDGVMDPNPRKAFIQDIKELTKTLVKAEHDIILMGDFNESIGIKPTEMASVMAEGKLTDTYCFKHGLDKEKPTYARGTKRVDYILVSTRLLSHIRATGAEPFNFRIFSDHRGIFVDFALPGFFDRAPNELAKMSSRDIIYDCPRHVRQYLLESATYSAQHKLIDRMNALLNSTRDDNTAEALDRDITRSMLAAERKCKSNIRAPWSMDLHKVMNRLYILKRALSAKLTGIDMSTAIDIQQAKLEQPIQVPDTVEEIKVALRQARRDRRTVIKQGAQRRKTYQQDKILALQMASPNTAPDIVEKVFHNTQASKEMFRRVPSSKSTMSSGISMIKIPSDPASDPKDPATKFQTIVDPLEVEKQILNRNRIHFSQAKDTPLANQRITDMIGFSGTMSVADSLLKGTYDVRRLTDNIQGQAILGSCRRVHPEMPETITIDEFKMSYKKWRVGTSTSPSGRHLSHQHVLFQPHGIDPSKEESEHEKAEISREDNWRLQHGIIAYAVKFGHCFDRWKQVVTAMIEKEPGNPLLHRLRVIHLYESDYNTLLGIKMRQLIHQCEDFQSINRGTYGSRANRQASDPTFIEVLQYDYAALTRWPSIKFSNDAASCYDRIIPSVSNINARSMGLHRNIAQIHGDMLENAVYRIKTQLGISTDSYSHSATTPVFGTGQGSTASPPYWLLNCSKYFDIYDISCFGATYVDMDGERELKMGMGGYVDDCGLNANSRTSEEHTLVARATHDAQLWSDILWSSGGALEHSKCSYHYLRTEFTPTGRPYFRGGKFGTTIKIKDATGKQTELTQFSAYQPIKTLGTYQAATHCQKTQFEILQKKAQTLTRTLALSNCSSHAAWLFYSTMFLKGIGYPLAVSRLTTTQLHALQGPMVSLTLNRMRYNKRTARTLIFGPRNLGGLEFGSLATIQGAGKLILLLRHLRTPGQPQELLIVALDRFQYMAGVGFDIMEKPSRKLPHIEGVWLPTARDYLASIDGSMKITGIKIQPLERQGDQYIMDIALKSRLITPCEIKYINYCRLYLQMLTISDMCNAEGTALAEGILTGNRHNDQSYSILEEPHQERPNETVWGIWRRFLRTICYDKDILMKPLGPWFARISTRRRWRNYYTPGKDILHRQNDDGGFTAHSRIRFRVFSSLPSTDDIDDPETIPVPIDTFQMTDGWRIARYQQEEWRSQTSPPDAISFQEYIQNLPEHESTILEHFDLLAGNTRDVCTQIVALRDTLLVTDGGAARDYGSFGWVLGLSNGTRLAQGWGVVHGHDPKSYRAEAHGAKAGSLFLMHLFRYCEHCLSSTDNGFHYYCDNEGLIKKLAVFRKYENAPQATCLHSEWDVISSIHKIHSQFQWMPHLHHVKGHQDRHARWETLDLPSQMNIEADALATRALASGSPRATIPFDPATGAMLTLSGRTITRHIEATLHRHAHTAPILAYYGTRFQWSKTTIKTIDWEMYSSAYKPFTRSRTFFAKNGWKQLPVGRRLHRWSPSYDHRCPSCAQDDESDDHVYQCQHIQRKQWQRELISSLHDTFGQFLDPDLIIIAKLGLTSFFDNSQPKFSDRFSSETQIQLYGLIDQQTAIGWDHFIRGKLSQEWGHAQYRYAKRYNLVDASKNWQIKLIRLLANASFKVWQIRNGGKHGIDKATKQQALQDQAHRELRSLYALQNSVMHQDTHYFQTSLETHQKESTARIRTWIIHHKKLILYSAKLATTQAKLRIKRLKSFFPVQKTIRSITTTTHTEHRERRRTTPTRMENHFHTKQAKHSTHRNNRRKERLKQYNTPLMSAYYNPIGTTASKLPTIKENEPTKSTSPQRRMTQRRHLNDKALYPDHPG